MKPLTFHELGALGQAFWSDAQLDLNYRRMEHLAALRLDLVKKRVLEVGGGIGDLTMFFLDRQCSVLLTDGRPTNVRCAAQDEQLAAQTRLTTACLNLDSPGSPKGGSYDVVFCYGVLHLLRRPERAIEFMAKSCAGLLLLEGEIVAGEGERCEVVARDDGLSGSLAGHGCAFTLGWLVSQLKRWMRHVYEPIEAPRHPAFAPVEGSGSRRAVLIASTAALRNDRVRQL